MRSCTFVLSDQQHYCIPSNWVKQHIMFNLWAKIIDKSLMQEKKDFPCLSEIRRQKDTKFSGQ